MARPRPLGTGSSGTPSHREPGTDAPVDPLYTQYVVHQKVVLGSGAGGGVVRGVDKETQEWHALKFLSRNAYDPQREMDTWQTLKHPNIVSLLRAFAPVGTRPHWVLAMPEADFTLYEYMRRSSGQARATEEVVSDLAGQLLAGIACVHEHGLVHRDIKPTNIMLSVVPPATSQGGVRLMIGDFSRARQTLEDEKAGVRSLGNQGMRLRGDLVPGLGEIRVAAKSRV